MKAVTKLIPASALALTLVVFTSCRIENIVPELEPYLKEVTGSDSTSFMSALSAAQPGSSTTDFKEGFKSGYAAGFSEAAKKYIGTSGTPAYQGAPNMTRVSATTSSNSAIPSWGYTSNASAPVSRPAPAPKKTSSSSRYRRSGGG